MSHLDSELDQLRTRLAALEEQKRIEAEKIAEKKAFPLKTLKEIIDEKRVRLERNCYGKSGQVVKWNDHEKVAFLEPIYNMLKDIQERLDLLEKRT